MSNLKLRITGYLIAGGTLILETLCVVAFIYVILEVAK